MKPKHLDRYVSEYSNRHNVRSLNTVDQMADNGLCSGART